VIGGCGFLGRHIVEQLLARGETEVAVFDIVQRHFDTYGLLAGREMELMFRNVTFYIGDITKPDDVRNAINKVSLILSCNWGADDSLELLLSFTLLPLPMDSAKPSTNSSMSLVPKTLSLPAKNLPPSVNSSTPVPAVSFTMAKMKSFARMNVSSTQQKLWTHTMKPKSLVRNSS
jgi:hypothetical protein